MATTYDLAIAGGGLGGAALANNMAERGAKVLVIERERQFKDRVRGEMMFPWGHAEVQALGVAGLLRRSRRAPDQAGWIRMSRATVWPIAK